MQTNLLTSHTSIPVVFKSVVTGLFLILLCFPSILFAKTILAFGDSLTAAYKIDPQKGWVELLNKKLDELHSPYHVINAGVSGDTTRNGLQRLPSLLEQYNPHIVILALGSNDGLRGSSIGLMKENLEKMIEMLKEKQINILFVGAKLPRNYGYFYNKPFEKTFIKLAKKYDLVFMPFLLEDVALEPDYMLPDGLHPNEKAQPTIMENIWNYLEDML